MSLEVFEGPLPSCTTLKWDIEKISRLKQPLRLTQFLTGGTTWDVQITPVPKKENCTSYGLFLHRCQTASRLLPRVRMVISITHWATPGKTCSREMLHEFKEYLGYGWPEFGTLPSSVSPDEDGLTLKIKIMVTTGSNPDALDMPLAEESRKHLSRALKQMYMGDSVWEPDVTLDLGVARIPAHRVILAAGSPVLKAMFQSAMADSTSASVEIKEVDAGDMEIILKYLIGKLGKIPEDRLSSLLLATDRFEVTGLMERCATMLQRGLAVESVIQVAVLADRINHSKLYKSCVAFASLEENRSLVGKHPEMMRVNAEDPRFSLKFMAAMLDETVDEGKRGQKRIRS